MGNLRRLKKSLGKSVCMAKTGITFEGCEVVLAVDSPMEANEKSRRFRIMMNYMNYRSSFVNVHDLMDASLVVRDKILTGEPIWN